MRRKDGKASASGLVLVRSPQSPESNGTTAKLSVPALQFRLRGVVGKTAHVKHLAALSKERTHISSGVQRTSKNLRMLVGRLGLADQPAKDASKGDGLLHGTPGRGGSQSLQMERKVMLDRGGGLDGLDLEGSADVGKVAGAERQGLGVVLLPALVFSAQVESTAVLEVRRQDDGLVAGFPGQLDAHVPRVEGHKGEFEVLGEEVLLGKGVEAVDGIAEGSCRADVFPGEGSQAR